MTVPFAIPAQLAAECHHLGALPHSELLLNRNAALPWFVLVPRTQLLDFLDLPPEQGRAVLAECASVSAFIKRALGFDKVNFAGLGNVVPQMHLHIIGRRPGDPCWPQPIWGNLPAGPDYAGEQLREWQDGLAGTIGLVAAKLD